MKRSNFQISLLLFIILVLFYSCKETPPEVPSSIPAITYTSIEGKAMGTSYHITYGFDGTDLKSEIDKLLAEFNTSLSTYDSTSTISKFNQSKGQFCYDQNKDPFFLTSLSRALEIAQETNGAFDPTVAPLVNYWGFGYKEKRKVTNVDKRKIDSIMRFVGYQKIGIMSKNDSVCISRDHPNINLDLNASAAGHGVDVVADLLRSKGIENFLVEIGGELVAEGVNKNGKFWTIGINKPLAGSTTEEIAIPVSLENKAMATSGNYRNFYSDGKITAAHIIDPKTGSSRPSDILSASIVANDCLTADAYATACMVLGLEGAKKLIEKNKSIEACLIYTDSEKSLQFYFSDGFKNWIDTTRIQ
jgi:FAD:protein FMN transferase